MSEQTSNLKNSDLTNFPRGAISIKGFPLGRNTRLPSIKSPRDLTLGAQTKRVFTPKIPVRREKKAPLPDVEPTQIELKVPSETSQNTSFTPKWKQKTFIQTEGSLFGEGIVSTSPQKDRQREPTPKCTARKQIVKKEIDMSEMNSDLDELLRDDFIDDGDDEDEEKDIKPIIYPTQEDLDKMKKTETNKKKSFDDNNFAKNLGFDVNKIARFIKKEKGVDDSVKSGISNEKDLQNKMLQLIENENQQLLLLRFPKKLPIQQLDDQQKISSASSMRNSSTGQLTINDKNKSGLSSLPEGRIGKLQILKSGRSRLVIGDNLFYLDFATTLNTKNEVVSIRTDSDNNDMIVLGNIDHNITVTSDVPKMLFSSQ